MSVKELFDLPGTIPPLFPTNLKVKNKLTTREQFLQAAHDVVPILRKNAQETNKLRRAADENIRAYVESGLVGMLRPKMYGGAGLELSDFCEVNAVLGTGCASSSWLFMVYELHHWLVSMLPQKGQDEVFGKNPTVLACGVFNAIGAKARAVEGGYMISGTWRFASGSPHSNWFSLGVFIDGREHNGVPEERMMLIPRESYLVKDNWHILGFSGTGSCDIVVPEEHELFVPEYMTVDIEKMVDASHEGAAIHDHIAPKVPVYLGFNSSVCATAIGVAERAIEVYQEKTLKRVRAFTTEKTAGNDASSRRLGMASIQVRSARLLFSDTVLEVEAHIAAGTEIPMELRSRARMMTGYATKACKDAVASLVEGSGASAMMAGAELGQALLDLTTMCSHHFLDIDGAPENYGRVLMGLESHNPMI